MNINEENHYKMRQIVRLEDINYFQMKYYAVIPFGVKGRH